MKRLNRNYWRLGWVLLTNGAVILLLLIGSIRAYHDQQLLNRIMSTSPPAFSYWNELFAAPWVPLVLVVLLVGMLAEVRRTVLSPIFNLAPYVVWLIVALLERARIVDDATHELFLGRVLLIFPLAAVIAVDVIFYVAAFRRTQPEDGDVGVPSHI